MKRVAVCIPTYRRPALLKKLLEAVLSQAVPAVRDYEACVIVCDNDVEESASSLVSQFIDSVEKPEWLISIRYMHNPAKGLCNVRNSLVECAKSVSADYILFIDDDEYPVGNWLDEIIKVQAQTSATVCIGHVKPYYDGIPDKGIVQYLYRPVPEDRSPKSYLNTSNTLIDIKVFKEWGLSFDMRFNLVGSEDTFLGEQILRSGGTIVNSAAAIAYEYMPEPRLHLKWHLNRMSRTSSTWVMQALIFKNHKQIAKIIVNLFVSLVLVIVSLPLIAFPNKNRYMSAMRMAHVVGIIKGFFGKAYTEYSK